MITKILAAGLLLLGLSGRAHAAQSVDSNPQYSESDAEDSVALEQEEKALDELAEASPAAYEEYRLYRLHSAQTYEEFLRWATPEEIGADLGIPQDASLLHLTSSAVAVAVTVHIKARTVDAEGGGVSFAGRRVTTGRKGHRTPEGCFMAFWGDKNHVSTIYKGAHMPYAVFFSGNAALHQGSLKEQSHGCVHLDPKTASVLYAAYEAHPRAFEVCVVP